MRRTPTQQPTVAKPEAEPPASTRATFAERQAAISLASQTGYDPRTCLRAILFGVDAIRVLRMRETLRPLVAAWREAQSNRREAS